MTRPAVFTTPFLRQFTITLSLLGALQALKVDPAYAETGEKPETAELDDVVVTASRLDTTVSESATSITIVSEEDLKKGQYRTVADALRRVPGLDIVQSGPAGGNASAFLRGANSEHTLVMLDGIELNNPATTNRAFNLANLTLDNVERIEVLRGPQSTLYGSDSLGGVINIITKGAQAGLHTNISQEGGSYNTTNTLANASYGSDQVEASLGVTRQNVGGISAAAASDGNREHDDYANTSLTGRVAYIPSDIFDANVTTRYNRAGASLDNMGGVGGDDPNRRLHSNEFFTRAAAQTHLLGDTLSHQVSASYAKHEFADNNDPDQMHPMDLLRSDFNGDLLKFDANQVYRASDAFSFVLGGQTKRERADSNYRSDGEFGPFEDNLGGRTARTNAAYTEARLAQGKVAYLDLGLRVDDHSIFGTATTYRVAPVYYITPTTKLHGTVGTGFKAPSLVQLYSSYGNQNLDAERSVGWDVGIEQQLLDKDLKIGGTFFRNTFDNLVSFNSSTLILENIAHSHTQGFEFTSDYKVTSELTVNANYTYTDSQDESTGQSLLRRPRNKGSVTVTYSPTDSIQTYMRWRGYGARFDNDFSGAEPTRTKLGGYGLLDLGASYTVCDTVELFTRIDNIFDKEYQEVLGYGTFGAAAYGGVKITL